MGGEVKDPEALVFGAELRCEYSDFRTYLLTEDYFSKGIHGLPAKFVVSDCKPGINILPFGNCNAGGPCLSQWMLADKWINSAGQDEEFGGEQIITTASHLVCDAYGFFIKPVNSGQHSDIGKQLMYLAEFDEKYPGLRAILEDPNGSLYLQDGMRDLALKFLSDEIGTRGGSIEIGLIAGKLEDGLLSIKNLYILSAIAHLDPVIDVSSQARFVENMQDFVTRMDNGNGANDRYLDKRMFELLDIRSSQVADNVAKGGWDLFYEQHKGSLMALGDMMMGLAQVSILYSSYTSWDGQQRTQGYSGYERDIRDVESGGAPAGYTQDANGRWHRPDGTFASNQEVGLPSPNQVNLHRPYLRADTRQQIEASAPRAADGRFIDTNTSLPTDNPVCGHKYGHENWREIQKAQGQGLNQQQFNDRMNNPKYYQIEDAYSNSTHKYEMPK